MSDHFEKFVRSNREQFDQLEPKAELWDKLQQGLNQQAATQAATQSAGSSVSTGASGLAKVGTIWKLAAAAVVIGITGTALYFGLSGDKKDGKSPATSTASTTTTVTPTNEAALKPLVAPPIANADAAFNQFTVEVDKGGRFTLANGTVLTVPANGFVTSDGAPVNGKVTLKYREFHDAADIMLSGIPMLYDEKGKSESGYFQTAGMVELLGEQNGQPVAIAQDRPINVQMASFTEEDDYNLYFLDPKARGWKDIGKAKLSKRPEAKTVMIESDSMPSSFTDRKPINPKKVKAGTELTFAMDYTDFPELKPFKNLRWAASDEKELKNKEWIFTQVWTKIELEQIPGDEMSYRFKLQNRRRDATLMATPILEQGDYEKALASFNAKMKTHKSLEKQRKEENQRRFAEATVFRTFEVAGFGIYNCDRILRMAKPRTVKCEFAMGENTYVDPATQYFHLTGEFRAVIPIIVSGRGGQDLTYSAAAKNYLVAVMPGGTLGIAGPEAFERLDPVEQERTGKTYRIDLKDTGKTVTNAVELRDILGV